MVMQHMYYRRAQCSQVTNMTIKIYLFTNPNLCTALVQLGRGYIVRIRPGSHLVPLVVIPFPLWCHAVAPRWANHFGAPSRCPATILGGVKSLSAMVQWVRDGLWKAQRVSKDSHPRIDRLRRTYSDCVPIHMTKYGSIRRGFVSIEVRYGWPWGRYGNV